MEPIDILRGALAHLRYRGWTQGQYGPFHDEPLSSQRCCAAGAMIAVADPTATPSNVVTPNQSHGFRHAWFMLSAVINDRWPLFGITDWNDMGSRTFADIERGFERAIELEELYLKARAQAIREGANDLYRITFLRERGLSIPEVDNV